MDVSAFAVFDGGVLDRKLGGASSLKAATVAVGKDCVCLGLKHRLVVATMGRLGQPEFQTVDESALENDCVTCVELAATPDDLFGSSRRGRMNSAVFVCGTAAGWLRWFRSDGRLLLSHRLHDAPVRRIKGNAVLFEKAVVVLLDDAAVLAALRLNAEDASSSATKPASFPYQKFELEGQRVVNDLFTCAGAEVADPWSTLKSVRSTSLIVCGGAFPMLGLYVPLEKHGRLLGLASELTSKLTSAVFSMAKSWWSSGNESSAVSPVKAPKIEEARSLDMGFELNDSAREIHAVVIAPGENPSLAAACDNFGRVLLVDLEHQIVVRMWKGYRDAQVAWMEQDDALFLVMYAPRRGIMEVWRMRHGQREAMSDVGTDCTLVRGGTCCYLVRPALGQIQKVQFSAELSNHLKVDRATLDKIKQMEDRSQIVPLVKQMRHPKMLVQAVLSLSQQDSSSLFQEVVAAALEQCNASGQGGEAAPLLTPGAPAARVLSQDVTHLLWLDRFVRAYRAVENTSSPSLSCRRFLWCFSVHGAAEARLTAGIPDATRLELASFLFAAKTMDQLQESLRWTRLSQSDSEALLADCLLNGTFDLASDAVSVFGRRKKYLDLEQKEVVLPLVLARVCGAKSLESALRVCNLVLQHFDGDLEWSRTKQHVEQLLAIGSTENPTVVSALEGSFSLFKEIARMELSEAGSAASKLQSSFPKHFEQRALIGMHVCVEAMSAWSNNWQMEQKDEDAALNVTVDEDANNNSEDEGSADVEPESQQAQLLARSAKIFLSESGALALYVWQNDMEQFFWKCASLVDLARKTPSEHVVVKSLRMSGLSDFRHFCRMCREVLKHVVERWDEPSARVDLSAIPFPSGASPSVSSLLTAWKTRASDALSRIRASLLAARAVCAVLKHDLRGVNVACVLPPESPLLKEKLKDSKASRFGSTEYLRKVFILKLLPCNNNFAVSFAKSLDVDLGDVRKMASQMSKLE